MTKVGMSLTQITADNFNAATKDSEKIGDIPIVEGVFEVLPQNIKIFVVEKALLMTPNKIYIVDGSEQQIVNLKKELIDTKLMVPLKTYDNNWLVRTDPKDVACMREMTWIVTNDKFDIECHAASDVKWNFGRWMDRNRCSDELDSRFPKCMAGRTLYVVPFSLGATGAPLCISGVLLTDTPYIVLMMCIMTRVSPDVWLNIGEEGEHVSCIHSIATPLSTQKQQNWRCNLEKALTVHLINERQVWSFGTTYGYNTLTSIKCFGLQLASVLAYKNDWLAEHMLIIGVKPPGGEELFIAAAFSSRTDKINLATMKPSIKGWEVRCIGCDIAWLKFGLDDRLYGYNPASGILCTAPGSNNKTSPHAITAISKNTIFTNVAETANGEYFWEGLEQDIENPAVEMINWQGQKWKIGQEGRAAHTDACYCVPFEQIPNRHPEWDTENGVPISAIIFGTNRSLGIPLVTESLSWQHGVFMAASLRSESTCAKDYNELKVEHDPMAMGSFIGYNLGKYLQYWLDMDSLGHKVPKIFFVNFSQKDSNGKCIWPGCGENIRILEWIVKKVGGAKTTISRTTVIGNIPTENSISCSGLPKIDIIKLLNVQKDFWLEEAKETRRFFEQQIGSDLPPILKKEMEEQEKRINEI
ncbi:phosphoenolpyruvate carboxykinase [Loa loa]|uniref:phosphoenolpyruvate carboxykinase (GTP) n=1 Tax=Loa loa TaxID=7209 RepID=A0A1I7VR02_LOALO|nr:phosphoenolpyruvate carboxykinase [Loa loa]EFO26602.1 phosphoenolpyruvate carboxykinase [Loa loa]